MGLIRRRWRVVKYSKITGNILPTSAPESTRRFWTFLGANAEAIRLIDIAIQKGLPYTYRVRKTG